VGEHVEVCGLASHEAAERDDRVVAAGVGEHRDRARELERPSDLEKIY